MNNLHARLLRATSVLAAVAVLVSPTALAQIGTFGTQLKVGDLDYIPLTKSGAIDVEGAGNVLMIDMGSGGDIMDNCVILNVKTPAGISKNDQRLVPCDGKPAGSPIDFPDVTQTTAAATTPAVFVSCADVNSNAKYDKGDLVYITTAATGLAPSISTASWTIRMIGLPGLPAGTFVRPTDADFVTWKAQASPTASGCTTWSAVEREDKGWYMVPVATAAVPANVMLPVNSIRIGLAGTVALQPLIQGTGFDLPATAPKAGELYKLTVRYSNDGGEAGVGLLVTKVDGVIADVRLTPVLGVGDRGSTLVSVLMPDHGGEVVLDVAGSKVRLFVDGVAESEDSSSQVAALEARIAQLEAHQVESQSGGNAVASTQSGIPGVGPLAVIGLLGLAVAFMRRRSA